MPDAAPLLGPQSLVRVVLRVLLSVRDTHDTYVRIYKNRVRRIRRDRYRTSYFVSSVVLGHTNDFPAHHWNLSRLIITISEDTTGISR